MTQLESTDSPDGENIISHESRLSKKTVSTTLNSSLPSQFYTSQSVYELERRAIFSQRWILISHEARYRNVGDFVQYDMAGFNFVVLRNKAGKLIAFHNVCRHRGHPVIQKASGHASIFSCRYHGWSYNLNGELTKAPRFDPATVPAFNPTAMSLFPVHTHVDGNGFVYINLDARKDGPSISWEEQFAGLDQQPVLTQSGIDWGAVEYDHTWTQDGTYNWKLLQDNYNECYHCLTAHPEVAKTTRLDTYFVEPSAQGGYICHYSEPKASANATAVPSQPFTATRFAARSATHVFPVGHFSPNPGTGFMHLMRTVPTSARTVRQEYDVYKLHTPTATPEAHARMLALYRQITGEDVELCEAVQRNHERAVFGGGPLHPFHEEGVLAFQRTVKGMLEAHLEEEQKLGQKIEPALRAESSDEGCARILACAGDKGADLSW